MNGDAEKLHFIWQGWDTGTGTSTSISNIYGAGTTAMNGVAVNGAAVNAAMSGLVTNANNQVWQLALGGGSPQLYRLYTPPLSASALYNETMTYETMTYQYQHLAYNYSPRLGYNMVNVAVPMGVESRPAETPEQRAAREAGYNKRLKEELARRDAARDRAESLLFTILTPSQVKQYRDDRCFETEVNGRIYRIKAGVSGNVELIEAGRATARYCAHPSDAYDVPVQDVMLSQLLTLKANEAEFLRVANRTVLQ